MNYIEGTSKKRKAFYKFSKHAPKFIRKKLDAKKCYWSAKHRRSVRETIAAYDDSMISNGAVFKEAYTKLCYKDSYYNEQAKLFFTLKISPLKVCGNKPGMNEVILLLVVKNDLDRVRLLLKYYRKHGITRFVILDDKSDDGTREFLMGEPDTDVYESDINYSTIGRQAWLSRFVDMYGFDRWYLIVDSDELISYVGMDKVNIKKLAQRGDEENRTAFRMMLLEMYPDGDILNMPKVASDEIEKIYCYFDRVGYYLTYSDIMSSVVGGVRCRYFYENNYKEAPFLTKYPLVKMKPGMLPCFSHMNFPFEYNKDLPLSGCLLHYKFLPQDIDKYKARVKSGNFALGSKEYVKYYEVMEKNGKLNLFDKKISSKYEGPESLRVLEVERFGN